MAVVLSVVSSALFTGACGGGGGGGGSPASTYSISGTVSGAVVSGVTVYLTGAATTTTTTDGSGNYTFANLDPGTYSVAPSKAGNIFSPVRTAVTLSTANATGRNFAATALRLLDDFGSGSIVASRWDTGQFRMALANGAAVLQEEMDGAMAATGYGTSLKVRIPQGRTRVTHLEAKVQLSSSSVTGDTIGRVGIDLLYQPLADRLHGPYNLNNAIFARIVLEDTVAGGLLARRQLFQCTAPNPTADCSTSAGFGAFTPGTPGWPQAGLTISRGTTYRVSIAVDSGASTFTFAIRDGVTDAMIGTTTATFTPPELSLNDFHEARLLAQVRGGASGGGNGAVEGQFDDVTAGFDGQAQALFDDFNAGTEFDPTKWSTRESGGQIAGSALQVSLSQAGEPGQASLRLAGSAALTALQADVTVASANLNGTGRIGARIAKSLYNDGGAGIGPVPDDVNQVNSQVGDVIAQVNVTATDVSYAVVRCNVADCANATGNARTFVQPFTSLGTATLGSARTLLLWWDATGRKVNFQLGDGAPVTFDPVVAGPGYPWASDPHVPFSHVANVAGAASATQDFAAGSSGSITSEFRNVRVLP